MVNLPYFAMVPPNLHSFPSLSRVDNYWNAFSI